MEPQFEVTALAAGGRAGKFTVRGKTMVTPNIFVVVDPRPTNVIPCADLAREFGVEAVFANAYIAFRESTLREAVLGAGSIHHHLGFDGIVATDSGAFQQYMYGGDLNVSPPEIENFEEKIGADCPVILDIPVQLEDSRDVAASKVEENLTRARDNIKRRTASDRAWFGPVHGSKYLDLLHHSAQEMSLLDFGIYAVGGVVKIFNQYRFDLGVEAILTARQHVRPDRPLHVFGLGLPQFFALAVACGADTFDSAAYALYAKEGRYFALDGTRHLAEIQEFSCCCPVCSHATPLEVRGMPSQDQQAFLTRHNLYCTMTELRAVREAVREGTLWELAETRARGHPRMLDALRVAGGEKYQTFFDQHEPRICGRGIAYTGPETLNRACIRRGIRALLEDYQPPDGRDLAIILPEVDTSPRVSPASREWIKAIEQASGVLKPRLHFLHASGLFGILPEELLDAYPFSQSMSPITPDASQVNQHISVVKIFLKKQAANYQLMTVYRPARFTTEHGDEVPLLTHVLDYLIPGFLNDIRRFKIFTQIPELAAWVTANAKTPAPLEGRGAK